MYFHISDGNQKHLLKLNFDYLFIKYHIKKNTSE